MPSGRFCSALAHNPPEAGGWENPFLLEQGRGTGETVHVALVCAFPQ